MYFALLKSDISFSLLYVHGFFAFWKLSKNKWALQWRYFRRKCM